jgi:hypothetical protein
LLQCRKLIAIGRQTAGQPLKPQAALARLTDRGAFDNDLDDDWTELGMKPMNMTQLRLSRRSMIIAATALVGVVSLAIGAHAALSKRVLEQAAASMAESNPAAAARASRIALVIGNGHYPDDSTPMAQPVNDARALTAALRHNGFDVDVVEDAGKDDMSRAIGRLKSKIKPGSVVMLFFGGYGIQAGRESYMIPIDAAIWKETDVRREGFSIEAVLETIKDQGARAKLVVIDASRRNPFERRFRAFSHGLAPINPPDNTLILSSATPGMVADDSKGAHSVLMAELLGNINAQPSGVPGVEALFNKTRVAISRASDGEQVPSVSSSLPEDVSWRLAASDKAGG